MNDMFYTLLCVVLVHTGAVLLCASAAFELTRLVWTWRSVPAPAAPQESSARGLPHVSIHVPTHAEPPEVVLRTLQGLVRQDYPSFDVLVLDNNTEDPRLWKPVEAAVGAMPDHIRFVHAQGVQGFKAGALDLAREHMPEQASIVGVLDADYVAAPDMLRRAVEGFEPTIGLVQFPQAYFNVSAGNQGMRAEYKHFFDRFLSSAARCGAVFATGTSMFVRVQALKDVGGWGARTVTEDAEFGLSLLRKGWQTRFINQPVARGMMPHDRQGYMTQRHRWIYGNAQVLLEALRAKDIGWAKRLSLAVSLTAWANTLGLVALGMACALLLGALGAHAPARLLALGSVVCGWGVCGARLVDYVRTHGWSTGARAWATHLGSWGLGATSWWRAWWFPGLSFKRTDKFCGHQGHVALGPGVVGLLACVVVIAQVDVYTSTAFCCLVMLCVLCSAYLDLQLMATARLREDSPARASGPLLSASSRLFTKMILQRKATK